MKWMDQAQTILVAKIGDVDVVIEPGHALWGQYSAMPGIAPYSPPPPLIPSSVSPAQMRVALHRAGLLATVQAIADAAPEAKIIWEYATVILRSSPLISAMSGQSGLTETEIDALFVAAAAI